MNLSNESIMLTHHDNLSVCGVSFQLFRKFVISPFIAQGYNQNNYLSFLSKLFPQINSHFMNKSQAQMEKGFKVSFDFNCFLNYNKEIFYCFPKISESSLIRQIEYLEILKWVYKTIDGHIQLTVRLLKKIEIPRNCTICVFHISTENQKLFKLLKNQKDVSLVQSSLFPYDTLKDLVNREDANYKTSTQIIQKLSKTITLLQKKSNN